MGCLINSTQAAQNRNFPHTYTLTAQGGGGGQEQSIGIEAGKTEKYDRMIDV